MLRSRDVRADNEADARDTQPEENLPDFIPTFAFCVLYCIRNKVRSNSLTFKTE